MPSCRCSSCPQEGSLLAFSRREYVRAPPQCPPRASSPASRNLAMCKAVVSTPFFYLKHQACILICPFKISISGCPSDTSNSTCPEQNVLPTPRPPPEAPMQHFFSQSSKTQHPSQAPKPEPKAGVTFNSSIFPLPHICKP